MPDRRLLYTHMPYCIKRINDRDYVLLNRDLKPLGFMTKEHVDYEDCPIKLKLPGLTPERIRKLSGSPYSSKDCIYFYCDGSNPLHSPERMDAYTGRLKALAGYKAVKSASAC